MYEKTLCVVKPGPRVLVFRSLKTRCPCSQIEIYDVRKVHCCTVNTLQWLQQTVAATTAPCIRRIIRF